jgi:hypothetical protein
MAIENCQEISVCGLREFDSSICQFQWKLPLAVIPGTLP